MNISSYNDLILLTNKDGSPFFDQKWLIQQYILLW